ncbi:putative transcriptional regulator, TetR family [Nocardia nova SH22a]|uniref:Putative transcriptional regulator, TetR family n=1 Tax=Nocardia nova SH22a TaxID=1415166 RepID=W5TQA1_9NOCA|nr:TetR family transcriptional regulator [Nocardia nova]AHH19401.1 putative transcriptional regulator, TetR family [Nocardia nova SH22a]
MATAPNFQSEMRLLLRERVIDTARRLLVTEGWGAVNMSRVAKEVGVSRPVLYKEIGTKQDLADVVIANEVDVFLVGIAENLAAHADDVIAGVLAAIEFTLRTGSDNMLLKAVLSGRSAPDTALLPALMTEPEPVLGRAVAAVTAAIRAQYELAGVTDDELAPVAETVVRLALSHLFQPTGPVEAAMAQIRVVAVGLFEPLLTRD